MQAKGTPKKIKEFLITFATEAEAAATIKALETKKHGPLYIFNRGAILITGMGALRAAVELSCFIQSFETVWNIGLAGSRSALSGIVEIKEVHKFCYMPPSTSNRNRALGMLPPIGLQESGYTLLTSDFPIHDETLSVATDLVDMEGYGIAMVSQRFRKKLAMWKVISDKVATGGEKMIEKQLPLLSHMMADFLVERLS